MEFINRKLGKQLLMNEKYKFGFYKFCQKALLGGSVRNVGVPFS